MSSHFHFLIIMKSATCGCHNNENCLISPNSIVDVPEVTCEITSSTLVSDMHFVGLHCLTGYHASLQIMLLKKQFRGCQFHNNEEVDMAIHERLQIKESSLCCDTIFKLVPKLDRR